MKFRLRFSVRTLAIVVTLVCAYFGGWEFTKRNAKTRQYATIYGDNDQPLFISRATVPLPFVIVRDETQYRRPLTVQRRSRVYVWLFGPMFRLVDFSARRSKPDSELQRLNDILVQEDRSRSRRRSESTHVSPPVPASEPNEFPEFPNP